MTYPRLSSTLLKSQKATRLIVVAITWIAFLLRVTTLSTQSLWRDEVDAIRFSSWAIRDLLAGLFQQGHNGPLFFLLLRPWRNLTGDSEFALRYPSALMGTMAIPVGYVLARQLGLSRRAGILLGLLLTTSPYLVWYGQEAKMYTMLLVAVSIAFITYLKALAGKGARWWIVFVVSMSISFYLHILAPLMLAVFGVVALLRWQDTRQQWRAWLISMTALTLPYLPLAVWQLDFLLAGTNRGHPFYPFRQQFYLLLQLYSGGLFQLVDITAILLIVFLFLSGVFLTHRRASIEGLTIGKRFTLATWALLPPLIVYLISLRIPIFEDRYLIYITPAFYLIVVLGIILIRHYARWLAALCLGLLLTINLMGVWQQQRQAVKPDFRAAAEYLSSRPIPPSTIMVQMPYLQYTLKYYYPGNYTLLEGLWTNGGNSEESISREMFSLTHNLSSLWLVTSEEDTWDSRHLVRAWLNEHANLVDQAHFMRVSVYHYQFQPGTIQMQSTALD